MTGAVRRGLTLLEVVAAAVLLASSVVVCLPLIKDIAAAESRPPIEVACLDLGDLAERILTDPKDVGLGTHLNLRPGLDVELAWPDEPERPRIRVRVQSSQMSADHAWLVLECQGVSAARCIPIERGRRRP